MHWDHITIESNCQMLPSPLKSVQFGMYMVYLYTGASNMAISFPSIFSYNLSAILSRASASLPRTPTKVSVWSLLWSLSSWQLVFWASNWAISILLFCSRTSINWFGRLITPRPSRKTRLRFSPSWDVPLSRSTVGCFSCVIPASGQNLIRRNG